MNTRPLKQEMICRNGRDELPPDITANSQKGVTASAIPPSAQTLSAPAPRPVLASMSTTGDGGVIELKHHVFDAALNTVERHTLEVNHDDTNGIDLDSTADYVRITSHHWHDVAHRPTAMAYYGSGNDSSTDDEWEYNAAPTYGSEPTASNAKKLVTLYEYHPDSGRQHLVTDPAGKQRKTFFDDLGRKVAVAENWGNYDYPSTGIGGGTNNEEDRVTAFAYNGLGRIITLTAHNASSPQVTTYKYEDAYNAGLVTRTIYPDGDDMNDNITVTYNLDGSRATYQDQRGVVHTYQYDDNRRIELDRVTSFGSSGIVDDLVKSIGRTYDTLGRVTHVTSWQNNNGTGTIRNQVEYIHHPDYGNLLITEQSHEGAATGVPYVIYVHDLAVDGEDRFVNAMRPKQTIYPSNRVIHHTYGAAESIADRLSRVDMLEEDASGNPGADLTAYAYSGVGRLATADYVPIKVKLDLYQGTTNGTYAGFDRFGRVREHLWDDYDTGSPPNIAQVKYGYDYAGNRTWREDVMAAANGEDHDEFYTHDGLHRLKTFDRGDLTGSPYSGISGTPAKEEDYTLDQLGNWENLLTKTNGSTTLDQDRTHNSANETGTVDVWQNPAHDAAGNMTTIPRPKAPANGYTATYDAWNRLIKLNDGVSDVQVNEYDGLHRRIIRDETGGSGVLTHFYWNESWQCVEERIGASSSPHKQYVWHPYYIDALAVSYDSSSNKHYYTHDANMNVTAALNSSGVVVERYQYSPYGEVTILDDDFDVAGSQVSSIGNEFLYTGRRLDPETGLQYSRMRYLHLQLGRWLTRDPIGYEGGDANLYGYVEGMPTGYMDSLGLYKDDISFINYLVNKYCLSPEGREALHDALQDMKGPGGTVAKEAAEEEAKFIASLGGKLIKGACLVGGAFFIWWDMAEEAGAGSATLPPPPPGPGDEGYDRYIGRLWGGNARGTGDPNPECECECRLFRSYVTYDANPANDLESVGEWESKGRMQASACFQFQSKNRTVIQEDGFFTSKIIEFKGIECRVSDCGSDCVSEKE